MTTTLIGIAAIAIGVSLIVFSARIADAMLKEWNPSNDQT